MMHEYTTAELKQRSDLTTRVAENLEAINELLDKLGSQWGADLKELEGRGMSMFVAFSQMDRLLDKFPDLEELDNQTSRIAANLKEIEENGIGDVEELDNQASRIAANLKEIEENGLDLDALEKQTGEIVSHLNEVDKAG